MKPQWHELTDFQKVEIVEGCKLAKQVEVARDLKISCQTVSSFLSQYDQPQSSDNLPHDGTPHKLTASDVRYLVHTAESETHVPLAEIVVNTMFSTVSTQTLHRRLREEGIRKWKAVGRCLLMMKDAKTCYKWANEHQHLTKEDWAQFAWSDESLIKQDNNPHQSWVFQCQTKREKYDPKNIHMKLKYGGVKQMVWGCFYGNRLSPIAFIDGTVNSHIYISILQDKLLLFFQALHNDRASDIIFQQDNAKVYTLKLATAWLKDSAI